MKYRSTERGLIRSIRQIQALEMCGASKQASGFLAVGSQPQLLMQAVKAADCCRFLSPSAARVVYQRQARATLKGRGKGPVKAALHHADDLAEVSNPGGSTAAAAERRCSKRPGSQRGHQ